VGINRMEGDVWQKNALRLAFERGRGQWAVVPKGQNHRSKEEVLGGVKRRVDHSGGVLSN